MTTTTTATNGVSNVSGALSSLASGNASLSKVNFDTFLKLLVAQLKNQDPLNPLDGTQFTGQIAQFSSLEQQINGNNYLKEILAQRDFGEQSLATSYLGKDVLGPGNALVKTDDSTTFGYEVEKGANRVDVDIIDNATGSVVRSFVGDAAEGSHTYTWDGKSDNSVALPNGNYTLRVKASDIDGKVITSQPYVYGRVNSVLNDGTTVGLELADGRTITAKSVIGVRAN